MCSKTVGIQRLYKNTFKSTTGFIQFLVILFNKINNLSKLYKILPVFRPEKMKKKIHQKFKNILFLIQSV